MNWMSTMNKMNQSMESSVSKLNMKQIYSSIFILAGLQWMMPVCTDATESNCVYWYSWSNYFERIIIATIVCVTSIYEHLRQCFLPAMKNWKQCYLWGHDSLQSMKRLNFCVWIFYHRHCTNCYNHNLPQALHKLYDLNWPWSGCHLHYGNEHHIE